MSHARKAASSAVAAFVFMICIISSAAAEERLGVDVYPGAKYDRARTELLLKSMPAQGAAYRTKDGIAKVTEFYRKQGLLFLKVGSPSRDRVRFKKADTGVDVVVQSPWRDAKTGAKMTDTLILIFKEMEAGGRQDQSI
jgi:hypothetical protein